MMQKLILFLLMGSLVHSTFAQKANEEGEGKVDTKTLAYGVTTNSYSGIIGGLILRNSFPVSEKNGKTVFRYLAIEAVNIKNPRETSVISVYGSRFVFGKTNYFFSIRPEYGREFTMFKKDGENGIGLSVILAGGPSFGLQKPYYIKYANKPGESPQSVPFDPAIHKNTSNITGSGNIFQGLFKNPKLIPGVHFKAAGNIDMNTFNDKVTGLEIGSIFEIFGKSPEILAEKFSKNQQVYASVYLTLYFGNKKLLKKKLIRNAIGN